MFCLFCCARDWTALIEQVAVKVVRFSMTSRSRGVKTVALGIGTRCQWA